MNEHFRGPINTSNNSNMISQNPHSTLQATYFPVSPYDCESSTYSEIIKRFTNYILQKHVFTFKTIMYRVVPSVVTEFLGK